MRRTGVFPQGCGGGVRSDGVEGARVGDGWATITTCSSKPRRRTSSKG